ncbi:MAG TPA: chemotaxis protein CheW [Ktedonobacteraceae bacterium]|nr:chemotaxis protein CheW [Ktedonobacteraceae bacterium]
MLQRDAGVPSQSAPGALRRGEGAGTPRVLPANLTSPQDLANVPAEATVVGENYLVFSLLERELAIKAEHIQGVERLADVTPIPHVASWVIGVINLRGSIASVVDLRAFLGMEVLPHNPRTRLLSVSYNEMVICLVVDSVSEMIAIPPTAIITDTRRVSIPQQLAPFADGTALIGKRSVILMDASRLLFSEKIQHYA